MSSVRIEYIFREGTPEAKKLLLDRNVEDIIDLFDLAKGFAGSGSSSFKEFKIADLKETNPDKIKLENYKLAIEMFKDVISYELASDNPIDIEGLNLLKSKAKRHQDNLKQAIQKLSESSIPTSELKLDVNATATEKESSPPSSSPHEFVVTFSRLPIDSPSSPTSGSPRFQFTASPPRGLIRPWVPFNPFAGDNDVKQESWGLFVESKPVLANPILNLAKAIFENNQAHFKFKFEKEISEQDRAKLVKRLCELAREKVDEDLKNGLEEALLFERHESEAKRDQVLTESNEFIKYYQPTPPIQMQGTSPEAITARKRQDERIDLQISMEELDRKLMENKTNTQKFQPQQLFLASEIETAKEMELQNADEFLAEIEKYWHLANQKLVNLIELTKAYAKELFKSSLNVNYFRLADKMFKYKETLLGSPKIVLINNADITKLTPRDYFDLAYAIVNKEKLYNGAPVLLNYEDNAWAKKSIKSYFSLYFLSQIPKNAELFHEIEAKRHLLTAKLQVFQKLTAKYSQRFKEHNISLEQIQAANELEQSIMDLYEDIDKALTKIVNTPGARPA